MVRRYRVCFEIKEFNTAMPEDELFYIHVYNFRKMIPVMVLPRDFLDGDITISDLVADAEEDMILKGKNRPNKIDVALTQQQIIRLQEINEDYIAIEKALEKDRNEKGKYRTVEDSGEVECLVKKLFIATNEMRRKMWRSEFWKV